MLHNVTINTTDINTSLLLHGTPGIVFSEPIQNGNLTWQMRIVDAAVQWSGRVNEPLRILASLVYRCSITKLGPIAAVDALEHMEWSRKKSNASFGRINKHILLQITPRITEQGIELHGHFANTRKINVFNGVPTTCETWKHAALRINQSLAHIGRSQAHHRDVKPISMTQYPELFFGDYHTFRKEILKHQVALETPLPR